MKRVKRKRKNILKGKLKVIRFAAFLLTIGFAGGVFFPLLHIREIRGVADQLQQRAENLDKIIESVRNGFFSQAMVSFCKKIGSKATNSFVKILENDSLPSIERQNAAIMLGLVGDKKALPSLVDVLESSDDEALRAQITSSLGRIGDASCVPYLEKLLSDPDEEVRLSAIEAMSRIGGERVGEVFIKTLQNAMERMPDEVFSKLPQEDMEWWHYYSKIRQLGCPTIKQFQKRVGLQPDGIIGPRTKKAIDEVYEEKTGK